MTEVSSRVCRRASFVYFGILRNVDGEPQSGRGGTRKLDSLLWPLPQKAKGKGRGKWGVRKTFGKLVAKTNAP